MILRQLPCRRSILHIKALCGSSGQNTCRSSLASINYVPSRTFAKDVKKKKQAKYTNISVQTALSKVLDGPKRGFDQALDVTVELGVDPKKPNNAVRGLVSLPHGTGKKVKVVVFTSPEREAEALKSGADLVGGQDLIDKIAKGEVPIDFNRTIATPDVLPMLSKVARMLGPKGLMPSPKTGNVTEDIQAAVSAAKKGSVPIKTDRYGIIRAGVGKLSFGAKSLEENLRSFFLGLVDNKPEGYKGKYLLVCHLSSTMGPSITVDIRSCDPTNPFFMSQPIDFASKKKL